MSDEPLRFAFSQGELIQEAIDWVKTRYTGDERYHILGLLVDFVTDIVPREDGQ